MHIFLRYVNALFIVFYCHTPVYSQTDSPSHKIKKNSNYQLDIIASGLNYPWSIAFLPNGDYLLSLRGGELRRLSSKGELGQAIKNTPKTYVASQGGYFDITLAPDFADNQHVYLSFAYGTSKNNATRIVKAILNGNTLEQVTPIFTVKNSKDTPVHYGGRMQFLNDGTLLLTTGDGFNYREAAQDPFSQLGKIIRIDANGDIPKDNPFADGKKADPAVYSLGHRSPQGLSYDSQNNIIYMHEHGPKGGDEVNVVMPAHNYGWPVTSYGTNYSGALVSPLTQAPGITDPIHYWTPSVAPSGLAYYAADAFSEWQGNLFVGTLVNQDVRRLTLHNDKVIDEEIMFTEIGQRIRDVRVGPDGFLYLLTDSAQGQVVRVRPTQ